MDKSAAAATKGGLRPAKPKFDGLVLVCTKCLKRQALSRGHVARSLKRAYKGDRIGRKLRVIETGCLGPCPKRMLALATPAGLSRGQVLLLDPSLPPEAVDDLLDGASTKCARTASCAGSDGDA